MKAPEGNPALVQRARKLVIDFVAGFALGGGLGIPAVFATLWQVLRWTIPRDRDAYIDVMVWLESFRGMFWPSSIFMVAHAPGDIAGEVSNLFFVILANVAIYAVIGLVVALVLRNRLGQTMVVSLLVLGLYGLNRYWSEHLASFLVAAIVLVVFFFAFFRKFGTPQSPLRKTIRVGPVQRIDSEK